MKLTFEHDIPVKGNLILEARERGKLVDRREGHNIFLDYGREWLTQLMAYSAFGPDTPERNDRVRYMGLGIGGTRQIAPAFADTPPLTDYGPTGAFAHTDTDPLITSLERPVRISGGAGVPVSTDQWMAQIQAPSLHDTTTSVTFRRVFGALEVSYAPYASVPLSEIGLFLSSADPYFKSNAPVAYDTFDTLSKTTAFELEVRWTFRIG